MTKHKLVFIPVVPDHMDAHVSFETDVGDAYLSEQAARYAMDQWVLAVYPEYRGLRKVDDCWYHESRPNMPVAWLEVRCLVEKS